MTERPPERSNECLVTDLKHSNSSVRFCYIVTRLAAGHNVAEVRDLPISASPRNGTCRNSRVVRHIAVPPTLRFSHGATRTPHAFWLGHVGQALWTRRSQVRLEFRPGRSSREASRSAHPTSVSGRPTGRRRRSATPRALRQATGSGQAWRQPEAPCYMRPG